MNTVKRIATGVGGVVMLALLFAVAMPKTAHAIVSTLVTVANTSSNPVPTASVKDSTANYLTLNFTGSGYNQLNPDGSTTSYTIPAGQQFVITDVDWTVLCEVAIFGGANSCQKSSGDSVIFLLGPSADTNQSGYFAQAVYAEADFSLFATRFDTLKSGYIVSQLPQPQLLFGGETGESVFALTLRGYLVPATASAE